MTEVPSSVPARGLPSSAYPRLDQIFRVAEEVWAKRPDLQAAFPEIETWDFWYWLNWHGSRDHQEIASALYPAPDDFLRHRVVGQESSARAYVEGGLVDWRRLYLCMREAGFDFARGGRLLDFGCGCGRIIRHFARYAERCELSGVDVDEEAVEWCAEAFDFATFDSIPRRPPTRFESGSFKGVYAFSVFSHLPERLHRMWLEELYRILEPGGVCVVTTQGHRVIERTIGERRPGNIPSPARLKKDLPRIQETGFAFYPYGELTFQDERNQEYFDSWDLEQYGSTFILEPYIHRCWTDLFHVVSWHPAPDDWQDYILLRRLAH